MNQFQRLGLAALISAMLTFGAERAVVAATPAESGVEFFERSIRPLLAEKCFSCHGRGQHKGQLSLDSRAGVMAGGENGRMVVPGKPEESLLLEVIGYSGDIQMPPDAKLPDRDIAAIKQWIALGLPWPEKDADSTSAIRVPGEVSQQDRQFWSFQPIREPQPPSVARADWPRRPLDNFVLHRLEQEQLQPVAEADRRTLIRRATFDLTGLPPTAQEVEAFVADQRPDAFEQLVERLLESPQYGERWARHWLDVARYGEDQAHTFQARLYPSGYRYRDWVINAFNSDKPYNQFLVEQIAGDLLGDGDRMERLPALGFFALGPVYYGDGGCAPKAKADEIDDRVDTLCRGVLGLTVSCARCHDHKFDPIPTRDYYSLAGVFTSSDYFEAPLAPADVVKAFNDAQAQIKTAEQRKIIDKPNSREVSGSSAPETARYLAIAWQIKNHRKTESDYKINTASDPAGLSAAVVERWLKYLADDRVKRSAVFAPWQALVVNEDATRDLSSDSAAAAAIDRVAEAIQATLIAALETRRQSLLAYHEQLAALPPGDTAPDKPSLPKELASLVDDLVDNGNGPFALPQDRVDKLLTAEQKRSLSEMQAEVERLKKASPPKYPVAHSLVEGKTANSKIQIRGNPAELGDEAPRRFLSVLSEPDSPPFALGSGRLELAKAVASRDNPLTARVFVNRVWQQHFGRGIVGTPSNFGMLGERPTHPELLDYLAARFMASGWSIKQLHREIMLSATYRLASSFSADAFERDPDNRLAWRMNRRKLDVESWRDSILAVSDNLDKTIGGPSLNLADGGNRRRTLYAAISRHDLNPMLRLFDYPDPNLTSERRVVTTVPMQQLFVLNSEFMVRQAKTLAARLKQDAAADDDARIERLYRWVLGRGPHDRERQLGRDFLAQPLPTSVSAENVKLSRWEQYVQALLSTNEFVFID